MYVSVCMCVYYMCMYVRMYLTHNKTSIVFVLYKAIMKPYKLLVLSYRIEICLLELLQGCLETKPLQRIGWVFAQWVGLYTVAPYLCVYSKLDLLLFTEGIRNVHH